MAHHCSGLYPWRCPKPSLETGLSAPLCGRISPRCLTTTPAAKKALACICGAHSLSTSWTSLHKRGGRHGASTSAAPASTARAATRCHAHQQATPVNRHSKSAQDVIVVGGGIAGLVSAALLAKEGKQVLLLEQNEEVGGRCQSVELVAPTRERQTNESSSQAEGNIQTEASLGSFRFDTGPSLLLFPDIYRRTYRSLGHDIEHHMELRRVQPAAYRVFFEGAGHLDMLYDVQQMVSQLEDFETGAGSQYLAWLASSRAALEAGMSGFIERDFDGPLDMLDLRSGRLLPLLPRLDVFELLGQHHSRLSLRFKDERLRAMFSFQDLYVGLSPYTAPGAFSLLAATELTDGVFYPVGGFQKVRDSLRSIAESLGVKILTGTRVEAINTSQDGRRVVGVTLQDGRLLECEVVIANRDLPLAYGLLQGGAHQYGQQQHARISQQDFSAGIIAFNWCLTQPLPGLRHHNVFLSADHEASWRRASDPAGLQRCPNFYVHVPSRTDPTAAPPGCESVMVLLPVANLQQMQQAAAAAHGQPGGGQSEEPSFAALVAAGREAVLKALCEAGACTEDVETLRSSIANELVIDPVEWASRYGLQHGAAFGLSHGLDQLAAFRPGLKDERVGGLYFTGASTRPGNGVPLCMVSAELVVQRVLKDARISTPAPP